MYTMYRRILYIVAFLCNAGLHEWRSRYPSISPSILPFIHLSNISLHLRIFLKDPPIHSPISFFYHGATAPSGLRPLHYRRFIILRHTTASRTPPWTSDQPDAGASTRQHTTLMRQKHMHPARFEPTIPSSKLPQTHALARASTGIGHVFLYYSQFSRFLISRHRSAPLKSSSS